MICFSSFVVREKGLIVLVKGKLTIRFRCVTLHTLGKP